jgi:ankyrin repeat protein
MRRTLTPQSSLEQLKKDAKRWLRALQDGDPAARGRFAASHPTPPAEPTLRDVQLAVAREYGFDGWAGLKAELERRASGRSETPPRPIDALLTAAVQGDAPRLRELLEAHPEIINVMAPLPGHTGKRSALHFAMNGMHEEVVTLLLERGADPNLRDDGDNAMPLHFAAEKGNLAVVRALIEHGADPIGTGDMHELEVIGWAACFGKTPHYPVIEYLLAHGGRHNLSSAVATGATDAIRAIVAQDRTLLDRPMDAANHRRRPLHLAVVQRQAGSLDTLLTLGADIEAEDAAGLTPLDQAALLSERAMAERLLAAGARLRIPAAVALDRAADLSRLLTEERDALRRGGRWQRLIIRAAERASGAVIEALIKAGASVHARDDHRTAVDNTHGYTALHAAAFNGNMEAIRVLLRHGADATAREDKYWGTPAGWANYAGHMAARDLILQAMIDIFDVIAFDLTDRLPALLARDPNALERQFGEYVNGDKSPREWNDPKWTPLSNAVATGKTGMVRVLLAAGANRDVRDSAGRTPLSLAEERQQPAIAALLTEAPPAARAGEGFDRLLARFLELACLDWRHGGSARGRAKADAGRLLAKSPALATASIYTAVVCGEIETVRRLLDERPELVTAPGGPRSWPPLLYLCSARLSIPAAADNAVPIARLLLDRGADPNAFYLGGNADIHYTALTCVLARGEDQGETHPRAPELAELLMERGAEPIDGQVLYNVFAEHASRRWLGEDIVWLMELMYRYSLRRGQEAKWKDPSWPLFSMWGAPSLGDGGITQPGAHFMLRAAIERNLPGLAEWMLQHGADPNAQAGNLRWRTSGTLWQTAERLGRHEIMRLLERYGATPTPAEQPPLEIFVRACLAHDRVQAAALLTAHPEYRTSPRALFAAVERNDPVATELVLDLGVSPDIPDPEHGESRALHAAAYAGAVESAEVLIRRGATVDLREKNYDAIPLGVASWGQQQKMVALLGRYSRDVWELTYCGLVERLRVVLEEEPALARASNPEWGTPLHWLPAGSEAALAATRLLLAHGADPAIRDRQGRTPAQVAERRGLEEVAELLGG